MKITGIYILSNIIPVKLSESYRLTCTIKNQNISKKDQEKKKNSIDLVKTLHDSYELFSGRYNAANDFLGNEKLKEKHVKFDRIAEKSKIFLFEQYNSCINKSSWLSDLDGFILFIDKIASICEFLWLAYNILHEEMNLREEKWSVIALAYNFHYIATLIENDIAILDRYPIFKICDVPMNINNMLFVLDMKYGPIYGAMHILDIPKRIFKSVIEEIPEKMGEDDVELISG